MKRLLEIESNQTCSHYHSVGNCYHPSKPSNTIATCNFISGCPLPRAGWIKVEDELPGDAGHYLVFYIRKRKTRRFKTNYGRVEILLYEQMGDDKTREWHDVYWTGFEYTDEVGYRKVTHWMPLPEPPKE